MDDQNRPEEERPRPRVVDKRVSAGGASAGRPTTPVPQEPAEKQPEPEVREAPATEAPREQPGGAEQAPPAGAGPGGRVWTPEQEAEARRMAEEIAGTPSLEWVVNSAVSLANIAATKLDLGDPADAGLAIDALSGILKEVGPRLGNVEQPLRQTLAQLQMAFAQQVTGAGPGSAQPGGGSPGRGQA
ncbi:MAG: hypothetical protein ACR2KQ_04430 [Actinomycetota bacterium]